MIIQLRRLFTILTVLTGIIPSGILHSQNNTDPAPYTISLGGDWKFATDAGNTGEEKKWYTTAFNDVSWKTLQSGKGWQAQGINHTGFGWYRKKITVPAGYNGTPLVITLAKIPYDDDVWFNGVHIGGLTGAYKYRNLALRTYTVPSSLIRYGAQNSIVIRTWGLDGTGVEGSSFGLIEGPYTATLDPYQLRLRKKGGGSKDEQTADHFDISDAQQGMPFEIILPFPAKKISGNTEIQYILSDFYNNKFDSGKTKVITGQDGRAQAVISVDKPSSHAVYLGGRFKIQVKAVDARGVLLFEEIHPVDHLSFQKRDQLALPALNNNTPEETPYGKLQLIDAIDCSIPAEQDQHPYMQSGFDQRQSYNTPGTPVETRITTILGKKARESANGWFAYRIGRGHLKPHTTYLVRIEYPEDKPRYCPVEIQTGENFMDIGWKNGVSPDNPYDNWPLSQAWQWFDAVITLDDETAGMSGAAGAPSKNGFWVYFKNKRNYPLFYPQYQGGPAISRILLYEIDAEKNAPVVRIPEGLPERTLMFDWERQPLQQPMDIVQYAKLMGYNAVAPVVIKWNFMDFADPLKGYLSYNVDERDNWIFKPHRPGEKPVPALPGKESVHVKYLAATKKYGLRYIPRIEYGGSLDLPETAKAIGPDGKLAKPNRFADWSANILDPSTWDDMKKLVDHLYIPYTKDNPQLTGLLWRIRSERIPISYGTKDLQLFTKETGITLPAASNDELIKWVVSGPAKEQYNNWWHNKRRDFHAKLAQLLQTYRPGMELYYYNWDDDKFSLGDFDLNRWGFLGAVDKMAKLNTDSAFGLYTADFKKRAGYTGQDYINMMASGNILHEQAGPIPHHAIRPELYKDVKNVEIFAPSNYLYTADKPDYLNYFKTHEGVAVSNVMSYDEVNSRSINPKFEGSMVVPGGPDFSMALELLFYFNADARTITYTPYTYGRGFADAHRRFAQAFLSLPATQGTVVPGTNEDIKTRVYPSKNGLYVGVASKAYTAAKITVTIPAIYLNNKKGLTVTDLVTGRTIPVLSTGKDLQFEVNSRAMQLNSFLIN